jgi:hypothetical protein
MTGIAFDEMGEGDRLRPAYAAIASRGQAAVPPIGITFAVYGERRRPSA